MKYKGTTWFWSGNSLMQSNNDGTFSSSHILTPTKNDGFLIEPEDHYKKLIASAPELLRDNQTKLVMMEKWVGLLTEENPQYAQVAFEMKEEMFQSGKVIKKATL